MCRRVISDGTRTFAMFVPYVGSRASPRIEQTLCTTASSEAKGRAILEKILGHQRMKGRERPNRNQPTVAGVRLGGRFACEIVSISANTRVRCVAHPSFRIAAFGWRREVGYETMSVILACVEVAVYCTCCGIRIVGVRRSGVTPPQERV